MTLVLAAVGLHVSGAAVAGAGNSPAGSSPTVDQAAEVCLDLGARFDEALARQVEGPAKGVSTATPLTNDEGRIAWGTSYLLSALAEMTAATREERYARLFVDLAERVVAARDDRQGRRDEIRGRIVKAWGSTRYSKGHYTVWAVHTGMIAAPLARFAAAVRRGPGLVEQFGTQATELLDVACQAVAEHDDQYRRGPGPDEGYLFGLYLDKPLPLNQQNALARAWIWIDRARGTDAYRERTARLARTLRHRMRRLDDGALVWSYWPDGGGGGFEDISHAAINVDFAVLCRERGIVFSDQDLAGLGQTLLGRVFLPDGHVADTVGGVLDRAAGQDRYASSVFRWARLASRSTRVRSRLTELARTGVRDSLNNLVGHALLRMAWSGESPGNRRPAPGRE